MDISGDLERPPSSFEVDPPEESSPTPPPRPSLIGHHNDPAYQQRHHKHNGRTANLAIPLPTPSGDNYNYSRRHRASIPQECNGKHAGDAHHKRGSVPNEQHNIRIITSDHDSAVDGHVANGDADHHKLGDFSHRVHVLPHRIQDLHMKIQNLSHNLSRSPENPRKFSDPVQRNFDHPHASDFMHPRTSSLSSSGGHCHRINELPPKDPHKPHGSRHHLQDMIKHFGRKVQNSFRGSDEHIHRKSSRDSSDESVRGSAAAGGGGGGGGGTGGGFRKTGGGLLQVPGYSEESFRSRSKSMDDGVRRPVAESDIETTYGIYESIVREGALLRRASLDPGRRMSLGAATHHRASDAHLDPHHAAILFRDSRGPKKSPYPYMRLLKDINLPEMFRSFAGSIVCNRVEVCANALSVGLAYDALVAIYYLCNIQPPGSLHKTFRFVLQFVYCMPFLDQPPVAITRVVNKLED